MGILNEIWKNICEGKYSEKHPDAIQPRKIVDDDHEQVMVIPNPDAIGEKSYRRKPGDEDWKEI